MLLKNIMLAGGERRDMQICGGVIHRCGAFIDGGADETLDCAGLYALPSFTDIHCHLREPGFEYKEDIASGTLAALWGGYRAVCAMPNTSPVTDTPEMLRRVLDIAAERGSCEVYPAAAITLGQRGEQLVDFDALHDAGAAAFSDDGHPVTDEAVMYQAMKRCAARGYLIITHPEYLSLTGGGVMNEGEVSRRLGLRGNPGIAEDLMIIRDIALAEATGCRLHIAHISTARGMQAVREAKARGVSVTAETCPHYFSMCDTDVEKYGAAAKMNPPLRTEADRRAVIAAIADGTCDCISTDHAPHSDEEKSRGLEKSPNGIIGIQTAFCSAYTHLVKTGIISLTRLCELMAYNPSAILGHKTSLSEGGAADITLFSPDETTAVTREWLKSKSANTPLLGQTLSGRVKYVVRGGELIKIM
ncbi:MAG: dihydroorotase [Eubacteriales bacterium]